MWGPNTETGGPKRTARRPAFADLRAQCTVPLALMSAISAWICCTYVELVLAAGYVLAS
jgi:hypothetical protein